MKAALLPLLLGLSACTAQPPLEQAQPLTQGALRCISLAKVAAHRVERGRLIYEMIGGAAYRNDLQGACPSLQRATGSEVVETVDQGPQLCRDDRVRIYDATEAQAVGSSAFPQCRMGDFVPVASH